MNIAAERPEDEIQGADAIAALDDALKLLTSKPKRHVTLRDVDVDRDTLTGKITLTVKFRGKKKSKPNEFTVRLSRHWATVVWQRLGRVLGK